MSDHLTFQRTPSQFALLIAVPAEVTAWLVADSLPPEKMYIPLGASFVVPAWADAAIKQSRRSLSAISSQDFIGGMMTESASPVRQSVRVIEIRPLRAAGRVTKVRASDLAGSATRQKRMQSVTPLRARNLAAVRFACLVKTALSRA